MIQNTNIFYLGYSVCRKSWKNKVGIFQERYQPFFPDFIGACSVKVHGWKVSSFSCFSCRTRIFQSFVCVFVTNNEKQSTITRLLLASRAKLRTSDIIGSLEELVAKKDLETYRVTDPEPKVSVPDIDVTGKDLAGYRYLVGAKNLMLTKKFLQLAKDNKSVPANILQAYLPAIIMIDNIVKGGPGFVQMLRTLENRAKKTPK